jgi:hypothetical protein
MLKLCAPVAAWALFTKAFDSGLNNPNMSHSAGAQLFVAKNVTTSASYDLLTAALARNLCSDPALLLM